MTFLHSGHNSKIILSANEMLEISQEISRDFTPCFSSRVPEFTEDIWLSPRELLDIGEEISRDFAPKPYGNVPELMLLPVDPDHLYAYWNLGVLPESPTFDSYHKDQLTLRIYLQSDQDRAIDKTASWFDVAVDSSKPRQQVSVPDSTYEAAYSAAIGKYLVDDNFVAFAHSNTINAHYGQTGRHQDFESFTYCLSKNTSGQGISKSTI
jgi:hypothetical protein